MESETTHPIAHFVFSVAENEQEAHILSRTDDWSTVGPGDPALLEVAASEVLSDDDLRRLKEILESSDDRFEIFKEVLAFFNESGTRVMRVSANRRGQGSITTVGFEVERGNGSVLKATPIATEAMGIGNKEEEIERDRQIALDTDADEQVVKADVADPETEVTRKRSLRSPR